MLSQRMINSTLTKVISTVLIFSIIGCEANGVIQSSKSNSEVEKNITSLTNIINSSNINILEQLNDPVLMKMLAEDPDSEFPAGEPILAVEEEQALKEFYANPEKVFREIAKEEDGEEFISLMTAISEIREPAEIRAELAYFLNDEELSKYDEQVKIFEMEIQTLAKTADLSDTWLHIMAGAAAALLAAGYAYKYTPKWKFWKKAALLAAIGVLAAATFGALKEAIDKKGFGTAEWRDFWNTVKGGGAAGVAIFGLTCIVLTTGTKPAVAYVTFKIAGAILAIPVSKSLFSTALQKLKS